MSGTAGAPSPETYTANRMASVTASEKAVKFHDTEELDYSSRTLEKKRNLTMKYGQEQRNLIRKRMRVENWLDMELHRLYDINVCSVYLNLSKLV